MPFKSVVLIGVAALVAGCTTTSPARLHGHGLERVMERPAEAAIALLGAPALDRREGTARQLQFRGTCTLDLYYYPKGAESLAQYAAARMPNGQTLDPGTCLKKLSAG